MIILYFINNILLFENGFRNVSKSRIERRVSDEIIHAHAPRGHGNIREFIALVLCYNNHFYCICSRRPLSS